MEENKVMSPGIKGLIISLVLIALSAVLIVTDQFQNRTLGMLSPILFAAGIIWACVSYSKQMDANVTFGNLFGHGFKASAAVAVISALWLYLAVTFLFPNMMDQIVEAQREALEKQGKSDAEIEQGLKVAAKLTKPMMVIASVFINLIIGAIASLIGAAVAKKNPNPNMPE